MKYMYLDFYVLVKEHRQFLTKILFFEYVVFYVSSYICQKRKKISRMIFILMFFSAKLV